MRYRKDNSPRTIIAKFAGKCGCCGGTINAGQMVDYIPGKGIWHLKAIEGNSSSCYAELRKRQQDPGFVDLDRMYEDQCADICGR
jgi:hypothetical protein